MWDGHDDDEGLEDLQDFMHDAAVLIGCVLGIVALVGIAAVWLLA